MTEPPRFEGDDDLPRELLEQRICDFRLQIQGGPLEGILAGFEAELAEAGIHRLRPRYYLSDEWGVPDGTVAIAIPFYLADVRLRSVTPRPRVHGMVSRAKASNQRWAMGITHIPCGQDGWAHLAAVIDCHDREVVGFELALRGRAKEAERAIEEACIRRFGTLRPRRPTPTVRSGNGLIFQSRRFRAACKDYRLRQEYITPYTPEQNGIIERFFRTLKEECVWLHNFTDFTHARREVLAWISRYNTRRPHSALGYQSPAEYRAQQEPKVA